MKKLLLIFFSLFLFNADASNSKGATLTVSYIGNGNDYAVEYVFYRDCSGLLAPVNVTIHYDLNGIGYDSVVMNFTQSSIWNSSIWSGIPANCASGTGLEKCIYVDTVSLPVSALYKFYRKPPPPSGVTTIPPLMPEYDFVEAFLTVDPLLQNSLPDFTSNPEFWFCINIPFNYYSNATDIDGDSIVYSIASIRVYDTLSQTVSNYVYTPPNTQYTFLLFMPPATIDYISGMLSFTPSMVAVGAAVIKADEFRNGVWIGSVMRESSSAVTQNCGTLGVGELVANEHLIYPNPAADKIRISLTDVQTYSIADLSGRKIQSGIPDGQTIDISMLKEGVYILSLQSESATQNRKLIKAEDSLHRNR